PPCGNMSSCRATASTAWPTRRWAIRCCTGSCATPTPRPIPTRWSPSPAACCALPCRPASARRAAAVASGLYLTLLVGPVVPLPAPKPIIDALTAVEVTINSTGRSGFRLSFTLSDRSLLQTVFLLAPPAVELRVVIMVTVNNIPQVLMDGVMRHHETQPASSGGHSTITIIGEDLTAVMDLLPM